MLDEVFGYQLTFGREAHAGASLELGYSYSRFHDHQVLLGAGPALRRLGREAHDDRGASIELIPHAVFGSFDGVTGYGLRTSLLYIRPYIGFEIAPQYTIAGDRRIQEVEFLVTFPTTFGDGS